MAIIPCSINETNFVRSFIWNLPATLHHPATFNHDMTRDSANTTRQPFATMARHAPLSSASFTPRCCLLALSHRSLRTNPAANDTRIAYFSLAAPQERATSTAVIPTSHDAHPTTFALYIVARVCPLSRLVFACVRLSTGH